MINKDLMMKAAIKFNGVWPSNEQFKSERIPRDGVILHTHKISPDYPDEEVGCISLGGFHADTNFYDIITCEQFESFVESLFEGAPEGTTHFRPSALSSWYKISSAENEHYLGKEDGWVNSVSIEKGFVSINDLIPFPAKDEPEAPYMPKVGEECEYYHIMDHNPDLDGWKKCFVVGFIKDGKSLAFHSDETDELHLSMGNVRFRPLPTERELFVEVATTAYLKQVGSDAVDKKWFGRIFGAMYDAGFKAP